MPCEFEVVNEACRWTVNMHDLHAAMLQVQGLGGLRHVPQDVCSSRPCGDVQLGAAVPAGGGAQQTHAQQRAIQRHWALRVDDVRDGGARSILSWPWSKCCCDCARGCYHVRVSGMRYGRCIDCGGGWCIVFFKFYQGQQGAANQTAYSVSEPVPAAGAG